MPVGKTSPPVAHRHVKEILYVLGGEDEVWRKVSRAEEVVCVSAGKSLTIPPRTLFQFYNADADSLHILIDTAPPWACPQEAEMAVGPWLTTITPASKQAGGGKGRGKS